MFYPDETQNPMVASTGGQGTVYITFSYPAPCRSEDPSSVLERITEQGNLRPLEERGHIVSDPGIL